MPFSNVTIDALFLPETREVGLRGRIIILDRTTINYTLIRFVEEVQATVAKNSKRKEMVSTPVFYCYFASLSKFIFETVHV